MVVGGGGCCVIFHLRRTCLLLAWFLMSGSFPLGMFRAILLRLNLRVADSQMLPWSFVRCVYF